MSIAHACHVLLALPLGLNLAILLDADFPEAGTGTAPQNLNSPSGVTTKENPKDGLTYVLIPPGKFQMGCSSGDNECRGDEKPAHEVTITRGFWIAQTPVTQAAFQKVIGKNPSHFRGDRLPVENVKWVEAADYCRTMGMRLPTEAEWEYAARAGSTASRYGNLDDIAWYAANSGNQTHEVGQKQPNAWMLYDMLGNVWEWTQDWLGFYGSEPVQNPQGYPSGQYKMVRGGSRHGSKDMRVSFRNSSYPPERGEKFIGFRCVGETLP